MYLVVWSLTYKVLNLDVIYIFAKVKPVKANNIPFMMETANPRGINFFSLCKYFLSDIPL